MRVALRTACVLAMAATGCFSGSMSRSSAPDVANDPAWTPPGEVKVTLQSAPLHTLSTQNKAMAAPQPNKNEIRPHQIRAAMR